MVPHPNSPTLPLLAVALAGTACVAAPPGLSPARLPRAAFVPNATTTAPGTLEVEVGVTVDPGETASAPAALRYGYGERTELLVGLDVVRWFERPVEDEVGVGDVVLGLRHRARDGVDGGPSAAFEARLKLPTAREEEGIGTGEMDAAFAALVSQELGGALVTGLYEMGFIGDPTGVGVDLSHGVGFSALTAPAERFGAFAEVSGRTIQDLDRDEAFGTVGLFVRPRPWLVFDVAVRFGLTDDDPDVQLLIGLTENLGTWLR